MARTALICPGQGAQKIGMGKDLCMHSKAARGIFDGASRALGLDIAKICFEGPEEELNRTDIAQPAILTTTMASLAAMKENGRLKDDRIAVCAGLSLGEYSALCYAGALVKGKPNFINGLSKKDYLLLHFHTFPVFLKDFP